MGNRQTCIKSVGFNDLPDEFLADVVQYLLTQSRPDYVFTLTSACKRLRYVVSVVLGGLPVHDNRFIITVHREKRIAYTSNYPWWVHPQRNYMMLCRLTCDMELYNTREYAVTALSERDAPYRRSERAIKRAARMWRLSPTKIVHRGIIRDEISWCHHENLQISTYLEQFPADKFNLTPLSPTVSNYTQWTVKWIKRARYYSLYVQYLMGGLQSPKLVSVAQGIVDKSKTKATNTLYHPLRLASYTQRVQRGQLIIDIMTGPKDTMWRLRRYVSYVQDAKTTQKQPKSMAHAHPT